MLKFIGKYFVIYLILFLASLIFSYQYWLESTYNGLMYSALKNQKEYFNHGMDNIYGVITPNLPDQTVNDSTVKGIDLNENSIRDDVDVWINSSRTDESYTKDLRTYAKFVQSLNEKCSKKSSDELKILKQLELNLITNNWRLRDKPSYYLEKINIVLNNTKARKDCSLP